MNTKFKLFFVALILFFFINLKATAQVQQILEAIKPQKAFVGTPILQKGSSVFTVGIGIPNNVSSFLNFGGVASLLGGASKSGVGPLNLGIEYLIKNQIGIGANIAYAKASESYNTSSILGSNYSGDISLVQIGFSTTYHLYTTDKLDPYFRGTVGLNIWKGSYSDASNPFIAPTPFGYHGVVGLRYFVAKKTAIYGELGYSSLKFSANIGVALKIK